MVLDPFAGTGTTLVVARQLGRLGVGIESSPGNVELVKHRLAEERAADDVTRFYDEYVHTEGLERIWGEAIRPSRRDAPELQRELFDKTAVGKTDP